MKITLTIWERAQLIVVVRSGRAPTIAAVELGLSARSVLSLSNEEQAEVGWAAVGLNQFGWDRRHENHEYELEFDDDVWVFVQALTRVFQAWPIDERTKLLYKKVMNEV